MAKPQNLNQKKVPWPTEDAMQQVYAMKLWGGATHDFFSGNGSHESKLVEPYVEVVRLFLSSFEFPPVVCDLGCGDFNVGQHLVQHTQNYIAADIVKPLIDRNTTKFQAHNLKFLHLDISKDPLPKGDVALLRQVLQHLSNSEVQQILEQLKTYKYVILTEHLPEGDFQPNIDIISGQGTRLKKGSGIQVLDAPFYWPVKQAETLLSLKPKAHPGIIETILYTL